MLLHIDDLIGAGVPETQAKVQSQALTRAIEDVVSRELATKADLFAVKSDLKNDISGLKVEIKNTEIRLIKWMIVVNTATVGLLFTLFKLIA